MFTSTDLGQCILTVPPQSRPSIFNG
ncbi:hypothetical protein M6B38_315035 [Iris pallida]|uniref:Uncharacterized protein n=1 Tax=Iris pallida TaxID=29817 RepID=A0AAX6HFW4_IRIPA|nr:hypothetical protein M6B38_315035 [Iris pallida]